MSSELFSKCRTCLSSCDIYHQLLDYVDENCKILDMLDGLVPQIDVKATSQFSTLVCQQCVGKLLTSYKFQQLCIDTNNRLHELLGIDVFESQSKLENILDPLMGDSDIKMKQEIKDDASFECEILPEKLLEEKDSNNDWRPRKASCSDSDSSNEKLSLLKVISTKELPFRDESLKKTKKINRKKGTFSCSECGKVLTSLNRLKKHTAIHDRKPAYQCEICNTSFMVEKAFKVHMLVHTNEEGALKIDEAKQNDSIKDNNSKEYLECEELIDEIKANETINKKEDDSKKLPTFQCSECLKCFERKASLSIHYKIHNKKERKKLKEKDKIYVQRQRGIKKTTNLSKIMVKEEFKLKPGIIKESINNFDERGERFNNDNGVESKDNNEDELFVKPAAKETKNIDNIESGIEVIDKPNSSKKPIGNFPCEICGKVFHRPYRLKHHSFVHSLTKPHPCMVCQRNYMSVKSLTEHIISKHPEVEKHKCDQCEKTFVLHAHLMEHLKRHKRKKNRVCPICEKVFSYSNSLKIHMRKHSGESTYLCPQCGKIFTTSGGLRQHMERHAGLKKYQCPECPSRFNCRSDVIKHAAIHSNAKPHVCDICGSSFSRALSLQKHKILHSGERPFKCDQCSMTFSVKFRLRRHMRTHTGEKPYKCKYCERAYSESGDLTKHLRTHVGENTYMCDQCPKAFKYQAELRQHQSQHYKMAKKLQQQAEKMPEKVQQNRISEQIQQEN